MSGSIKAKDLLQLKNGSVVKGNISAGKLQVEPAATFNGQCHMNALSNANGNVVSMNDMDENEYAEAASR